MSVTLAETFVALAEKTEALAEMIATLAENAETRFSGMCSNIGRHKGRAGAMRTSTRSITQFTKNQHAKTQINNTRGRAASAGDAQLASGLYREGRDAKAA